MANLNKEELWDAMTSPLTLPLDKRRCWNCDNQDENGHSLCQGCQTVPRLPMTDKYIPGDTQYAQSETSRWKWNGK